MMAQQNSAQTEWYEKKVQNLSRHLLHSGFLLGWFSTQKIEVIRFYEMSVPIQTTRLHNTEDCNIHNLNTEDDIVQLKNKHYVLVLGVQWTLW
jgi:hypothetical protein